jgi:hypothetical protein
VRPITELYGRLVNLDVASGFSAVAGRRQRSGGPADRHPLSQLAHLARPARLRAARRSLLAAHSSFDHRRRGGYGIYDDTSVYQTTALQMAQQYPLSTSLSVQNGPNCKLTLAYGFVPCSSITANTFAVDPNFRVGYAQTWQLSVQRDLPGALQLTATYLGVKGTRGVQQFLPNTYPIGAASPCTDCPSGFVYQTSGGDSTRQSGQIQLRRRLRSGFTASLLYTYSKSIDDDAYLGGQGHVIASSQTAAPSGGQGWVRDSRVWTKLGGNFGHHHARRSDDTGYRAELAQPACRAFAFRIRSTSPAQSAGSIHYWRRPWRGTLMGGWPGRLLKEWTIVGTSVVGTGLPETPVYLAAVPGTGYTGTIRPDPTGMPISIARKSASQPRRLQCAAGGAMGNRGQELDHRSWPVQPR